MTQSRRWKAETRVNVKGVDLRISQGTKGPEDLRMEMWHQGRWVPVHMALALAMVDFFAENERHLQDWRPHWRQNGDRYFLSKCVQATVRGWRAVADELDDYRRRRGAA